MPPLQAASTAAGLAKLMAHMGGAMAGAPLGYMMEQNGWGSGLALLSGLTSNPNPVIALSGPDWDDP